ncbi:DUF2264 domain-containing protein [Streptomyces triticagri]|uniref:DUF2264 domain-containing protein n=1 Tax=Streptomyces triticagri TaxID=2293568 RepID=A0A372MB62_9ACTN|nr:DUF2264 domain-containing protein [Streptomyces triticagri]RFU87517.1 DUF2264 domain-containing protein [Streptomyces triticagri]
MTERPTRHPLSPHPVRLPADDRTLSPYTGFTRRHWEAAADGLLEAAWRWATPGRALLDLPGRPSASGVRSDGLEGYARTFLAAGFRVAGAGGSDPHGWLERYADGLVAGTRTPGRDDTESWPLIGDHTRQLGQPMVESASVALGLRMTRPWLWDRLGEAEQDRAEEWLRGALRNTPAPNNWYLFPYTVAGFLESVGRGDQETERARTRALELLEGWYRGDGWYADGDGRAFDHYNGWALHLYPVLDAHLAAGEAGDGAGIAGAAAVGASAATARHRDRLRQHLDSFGLFFGADGAPLHMGRSLTYRFAATAAVGLGAVTGDTPLPPGVSRRLISGGLRYFLDRGALTPDGLLSLGWHGPNDAVLQSYSGPASPYWASKGFVCLLADEQHPLWTATEAAAPVEQADRTLALPAPGLLLQTTRADGIVRLHNHGSDHVRPHEGESATDDDPHYGRLAYSTVTGPTARANTADNHLAIVVDGARSVRRRIHPLGAGQGNGWAWAASWHTPVLPAGAPTVPGLRVESVTFAHGPYELRVHRVVGAPEGSSVEETGWATGPSGPPYATLCPLAGWDEPGGGGHLDRVRAPQGTAYTRWALLDRLRGEGTGLYASLTTLTGEPTGDLTSVVAVTTEPAGPATLRFHWKTTSATTAISFDPLEVTHVEP